MGCSYGSCNPPVDFPKLVDLFQNGQFKVDEMVSRRYALSEINDAYENLAAGKDLPGPDRFRWRWAVMPSAPRNGRLDGEVALVTGGWRGIGAAVSRAYVAEGAAVAINYPPGLPAARAGAISLASELCATGGKAVPVQADVSDRAGVLSMVERVASELGNVRCSRQCGGYRAPAVARDRRSRVGPGHAGERDRHPPVVPSGLPGHAGAEEDA